MGMERHTEWMFIGNGRTMILYFNNYVCPGCSEQWYEYKPIKKKNRICPRCGRFLDIGTWKKIGKDINYAEPMSCRFPNGCLLIK